MVVQRHLTRFAAIAILIFSNFVFLRAQAELPAGTRIRVRMDNGISSGSAGVDDTFTAVTVKPVSAEGAGTLPAETVVVGIVTEVRSAASGGKSGKLKVEFNRLRFSNGFEREISAVLVNELSAKSKSRFNALAILGGTAIGGLIGLVSGTKSGAAIGSVVGAGAGAGVAISQKGNNVGIESDQEFEIELTKPVQLPTDGF